MVLITERAKTKFEAMASKTLLHNTFNEAFEGFNYEKVAKLSPVFDSKTFFCFGETIADILSTATISFPTAEGLFPSEYFFGFKVPETIRNQNLIELGKLARRGHEKLSKEEERLTYISLLLAIKAYSQKNNIDGFVASVHSRLLEDIKRIGIPVTILETEVKVINDITLAMGSYTEDVRFIYAAMPDAYVALEKFNPYLENGTISIDVG